MPCQPADYYSWQLRSALGIITLIVPIIATASPDYGGTLQDSMTDHRATAKRIVLDLLVTWGATARPGMSELFDVVGSFRGRDRLAILPRILETPGVDLGPELQGELRALVEASTGGDSLEPGFEQRVDHVLARVVPVLRSGLDEQRGALRTDLAGWVRVLPPAERDPILERFWGTAEGPDLPNVMAALRNLGEVGEKAPGQPSRVAGHIEDAQSVEQVERRHAAHSPRYSGSRPAARARRASS